MVEAPQPFEALLESTKQKALKRIDYFPNLDISSRASEAKIYEIYEEGLQFTYGDIKGLDREQHFRIQEVLNSKLENLAKELDDKVSDSSKSFQGTKRETILEHEIEHHRKAEELCKASWDNPRMFIYAIPSRKNRGLSLAAMSPDLVYMPEYKLLSHYQKSLIDLAPKEPQESDYFGFFHNFNRAIEDGVGKRELDEIVTILESKPVSEARDEVLEAFQSTITEL